MNEVKLSLRRPKSANFIKTGIFAVLTAICVCGIIFMYMQKPQTDFAKILSVVLFTVLGVSFVFAFSSFCNAVRNLFSKPTVILDDDKIEVFRFGEIALADIDNITVNENKKILYLNLHNGTDVPIKKAIINLPLDTLKYAINTRR